MNQNQIGLACWGLRECSLRESLALCKKLGAKTLELGIANAPNDLPLNADSSRCRAVAAQYAAAGLPLICAATGNDFTSGCREEVAENVQKVCRVVDLCKAMNVQYLRIFAGFSPVAEVTGERWNGMVGALFAVARYAQEKGVTPVIETHGGVTGCGDGVDHFDSVTTCYETLQTLVKTLPENIAFLYDPANLYAAGHTDLARYYALIKRRTAVIHLKDFMRTPGNHWCPSYCGSGNMDWNTIIADTAAFNGPVLIEYENPGDVAQGCAKSLAFLQQKL